MAIDKIFEKMMLSKVLWTVMAFLYLKYMSMSVRTNHCLFRDRRVYCNQLPPGSRPVCWGVVSYQPACGKLATWHGGSKIDPNESCHILRELCFPGHSSWLRDEHGTLAKESASPNFLYLELVERRASRLGTTGRTWSLDIPARTHICQSHHVYLHFFWKNAFNFPSLFHISWVYLIVVI